MIIIVTISGSHNVPANLPFFPFTRSWIHSVGVPGHVFCTKHHVRLRGHTEEQAGASPALKELSLSSRRPIMKP